MKRRTLHQDSGRDLLPKGEYENSPMLQLWVRNIDLLSPEGTAESLVARFQNLQLSTRNLQLPLQAYALAWLISFAAFVLR